MRNHSISLCFNMSIDFITIHSIMTIIEIEKNERLHTLSSYFLAKILYFFVILHYFVFAIIMFKNNIFSYLHYHNIYNIYNTRL